MSRHPDDANEPSCSGGWRFRSPEFVVTVLARCHVNRADTAGFAKGTSPLTNALEKVHRHHWFPRSGLNGGHTVYRSPMLNGTL